MFSTLSLSRNARFLNLTSKKVLAARLWQVSIPRNPVDIAVPALQLLCEVVIQGGLLLTQRHIFLLKPLLSPPQRVSRPQQFGGSWRALHHLRKGSSSQVDKGLWSLFPSVHGASLTCRKLNSTSFPLIGSVYALQPSVVFGSASASLLEKGDYAAAFCQELSNFRDRFYPIFYDKV